MRAFLLDLWSHRGFRYTFITVLSIAACWTCFHLVLNWSGEKRWQRIKAKLEAEGETFDFYALYPPPIPDDQNFCAIEPLNGIRAPEGTSPVAVAAQKKREAIKSAAAFLTPELNATTFFEAFSRAQEPDYPAILAMIRDKKTLPLPSGSATWSDVRVAFEKQASILTELGTAAKHLAQADFLPRPTREELPEMLVSLPVPHFNSVLDLGKLVKFHGVVCLKAGDRESTLNAALSLLRLSQGADNTRTVIANLVGITLQGQFHQLVWLILQSRQFDDASLSVLQKELQISSPVNASLASFRSEMAMGVSSMECLERHSQDRWDTIYTAFARDMFPTKSAHGPLLSKLIPAGFIAHCKAATVELEWESILKPLAEKGLKNVSADIDRLQSYLDSLSMWRNPDLMVARWSLSVFSVIRRMSAYNEEQRLQAMLACALERHLLRHGSYPATLEALDPEFRVGNDLLDVNGEKMHYALIPGGRFRLWSPGPDGRDDGGKFGVEISARMKKSPYHSTYLGDWVWRYDPAEKAP